MHDPINEERHVSNPNQTLKTYGHPAYGRTFGGDQPAGEKSADSETIAQLRQEVYLLTHPPKQLHVAFLLLMFLGVFGAHRFYQGKTGTGLVWLFTVGLFGVGVLVDAFTLKDQLIETNKRLA